MLLRTTCIVAILLAACQGQADSLDAPLVRDDPPPVEHVTLLSLEGTPAYEEVLSRSFEEILSDSQRSDYTALDDVRHVYRQRFWTWNDPTPATSENEFLEEHVRRLDCVLALFCEEGGLEWDDRGEIVLRFGIPKSRSQSMGDILAALGSRGISPPSETWTYYDAGLSITFIDPSLNGRYVLGEDIKHLSARGRPMVPRKGESNLLLPPEAPARPRNIEAEHMAY